MLARKNNEGNDDTCKCFTLLWTLYCMEMTYARNANNEEFESQKQVKYLKRMFLRPSLVK